MAASVWKPGNSGTVSWTIKGVQETTREAVREAAAEAEMVIGDWVDRALGQAATEALHPSPPPATRDDVALVMKELAELKTCVLAMADAESGVLAEIQARVHKLAEGKASAEALAEVDARVQKLAQRITGYDRPAVRHVMVERKRSRQPAHPRPPEDVDREP